MSDRTEIQSLMKEWREHTGIAMPLDIAALPIDRIKVAIAHIKKGDVVFVPPSLNLGDPNNQTDEVSLDSMLDWDSQDEKPRSAYGG